MIRCRERERTDRSGRGTERVVAATSYLIRYSLEPLVPARSSISLSESLSHPLGDAGLDPRATACTRPDGLRTCSVVSCSRPALSLRSGSLSLTAPMQVAGPLLQVSGPSPAHAFPSVPIRTQTGHSRPSHSVTWGNILSPSAPGMPPQRDAHISTRNSPRRHCRTESQRYLLSIFVLTHVLKPWYVLPHYVTPLPPHSIARQHTRPRHVGPPCRLRTAAHSVVCNRCRSGFSSSALTSYRSAVRRRLTLANNASPNRVACSRASERCLSN